jgi:hypothetical protein
MRAEFCSRWTAGTGDGHEEEHGRGDGDGQIFRAAQGEGLGNEFAEEDVEVGDEGKAEDDGGEVGEDDGMGQVCCNIQKPVEKISAATGSPIQPRASEQRVTPSWTAGRKPSRSRCRRRTEAAPGMPAAIICSTRVSRMETRANSAATKKPLARMSRATATIWSRGRPCIRDYSLSRS